jgi:sulfate permease, SulP family
VDTLRRYLPFTDLKGYSRADLVADVAAALAVTFLCIPQGIAYALIAGLPPAMGLYAAAIPAAIASLFRSSRHLIAGPTNAVSLLVGSAFAAGMSSDPAAVAVTLALMVGLLQLAAGILRLGSLVDYISGAVVQGFVTGAAILIGVGQLANATATPQTQGPVPLRLVEWVGGLGGADLLSVCIALGTVGGIVALKRFAPRAPAAILALSAATGIAMTIGASTLRTVADLAPIPSTLPPLTSPSLDLVPGLLPLAVAVMVLSMVESTSVARDIATRSSQRIDLSVEFTGEGLGNLCAAFFGGYPITGSLSRSALNEREGGRTRLSGVIGGCLVLLSPVVLGPALGHIPIAGLAGLLVVIAVRLIHVREIRATLSSHSGDRLAFLGTLFGTFVLHLDQAIYLGVGISLVLVLRRARMLRFRDLAIDSAGRIREVARRVRGVSAPVPSGVRYCRGVHVLNVEGSLFFAAAGELQLAIEDILRLDEIQVVVLRIKRVRNLDVTSVRELVHVAASLRQRGGELLLVGMSDGTVEYLDRTGALEELGTENLFPSREDHWFAALEDALRRALELVGKHGCEDACPYQEWLVEHR